MESDNKSSFKYDNFIVQSVAEATAEKLGDVLILTLTGPKLSGNPPGLIIQIHGYTGPGTYEFTSGKVDVYGQKGNSDVYWMNIKESQRTSGKVTISRHDDVLEAEALGTLVHSEFSNGGALFTFTAFEAHFSHRMK